MQPLEEDIGCGDLTDGRHRVRLDSFASAEAGIAERELARLALVGGDAQPDRPVQTRGGPQKTSLSGTRRDRPGWYRTHFETAPSNCAYPSCKRSAIRNTTKISMR